MGDADSFGESFNDEETRYGGQWRLTEAELAEVRKIPDEFWDQIASGGLSASDWLFDYLESQGLVDGLDKETFPDLVQAVSQDNKLIGLYVETVPDLEVGGQTGQRASRPAQIWNSLQETFAPLNEAEQKPVEKDDEEEENDTEEDGNVLSNEEFLEALREIISSPGFQPQNSPLTGPWAGQMSPASGAFTGQSFQAPLIGGQIGSNPLVAPSRRAGPSYASPVFSPNVGPTPTPGPNGPAANTVDFAAALEAKLRELFPHLFEDEDEDKDESSDDGLNFYEVAEKYPDADWSQILVQHMINLHGEDAVNDFFESLMKSEDEAEIPPEVEKTFYEIANENPELDWNQILVQYLNDTYGEDAVNDFFQKLDPEGYADQNLPEPGQVSASDFNGLDPVERIQLWNSLSPSEKEIVLEEVGGQGSKGINDLLLGNDSMGGGGGSGQSNRSIEQRSGDIVSSAQQAATSDLDSMSATMSGEPQVAEPLGPPTEQDQSKQPSAPAMSSPTAMPATSMSQPSGGAGKGQPQAQQMGQAAQNLAQGLQPQQGQGTPLAGTASQSGMGGGLGAPTGRGMFTTK